MAKKKMEEDPEEEDHRLSRRSPYFLGMMIFLKWDTNTLAKMSRWSNDVGLEWEFAHKHN